MGIGQTAKMDAAGHSRTAVVEARVDVRDLATFARFLVDSGDTIQSRSDLIWRAFRSIAETLASSGHHTYTDTEEALAYLISLGLGSMNRKGRGGRPMNAFSLAKKVEQEQQIAGMQRAVSVEELVKLGSSLLKDSKL